MAVVDDIGEDVLAARMLEAAASGDLEHLKYLVQGGADPATLKDYDKRTALHLAVAEGRQLVCWNEKMVGRNYSDFSLPRWSDISLKFMILM